MEHRTEHLIESYFAGTITEAEKSELKGILAANPAAAIEFALQQKLASSPTKRSLAQGIQNTQMREATKPPFRKVTMWKTAMSAAAAIALLVAAYYFIPRLTANHSPTIVADSIVHFPNKMKFKNLGGNAEEVSTDVLDAFAAYDQEDYLHAIPQLMDVVNNNPDRMDYRFYLGVSFLRVMKFGDAINTLYAVANDAKSSYRTPACYFIGVAYAAIKDKEQAKKYLNAYLDAEDGVTYKKQARDLVWSLE